MGISIPIGPEHYDKLKMISDKLGLGLKKTMEFLVSEYWQKEIEHAVVAPKRARPNAVEPRQIRQTVVEPKRARPSAVEPRQIQEIVVEPEEATPSILESRQVKPLRQLLEELSREYNILPFDVPATPVPKPQRESTFNPDILKKESNPLLQDMVRSCPSCGSPKRTNAKFCNNCGSLL